MTKRIESKRAQLKKICNGEPDALYLLSGISKVIGPLGDVIYKPGNWAEVDWKGYMSGGEARALAVVELAKAFPHAIIAVNSNTFNTQDPQAPTDVEVMAGYLEQMGIGRSRMITQDRSTTTFAEIVELVKYFDIYRWKSVVVVVGETQRPRTEEMFRQINTLHDPGGTWKDTAFQRGLKMLDESRPKITFVSAEEVLQICDKRYIEIIALARKTEIWKEREELDQRGYNALKSGTYW